MAARSQRDIILGQINQVNVVIPSNLPKFSHQDDKGLLELEELRSRRMEEEVSLRELERLDNVVSSRFFWSNNN